MGYFILKVAGLSVGNAVSDREEDDNQTEGRVGLGRGSRAAIVSYIISLLGHVQVAPATHTAMNGAGPVQEVVVEDSEHEEGEISSEEEEDDSEEGEITCLSPYPSPAPPPAEFHPRRRPRSLSG